MHNRALKTLKDLTSKLDRKIMNYVSLITIFENNNLLFISNLIYIIPYYIIVCQMTQS